MAKVIPCRQCLGCGEKKEKTELIRIVRGTDGCYSLDETGRMNGRGAYICKNPACFDAAVKRKGFERSFKESIPADVISRLKGEFEDLGQK